ncbi:MAG: hypothetical protein HXY37_16895 [Chloroflexi bacterium]|nr:hypothetical protein [Chloroflexota bacterium]
MLWKGLVAGSAAALVALALFVALTSRPMAAGGTLAQPAPAGNVIVLPNGLAMPQLQPAQPATAPALLSDVSLVSLVSAARDNAETTALKLTAEKSVAGNASTQQALMGCGDK